MAQIAYPTGVEYSEALQNTGFCFQHPDIAAGQVTLTSLGLPKAISGNFATVFQVTGRDKRRWAVKCFTRYVPDQEQRYQAIASAISSLHPSWSVPFEYLPEGIRCSNSWFPVLKMQWIDATPFLAYVEAHRFEPGEMAFLAGQFLELMRDLARNDIAHGDLQHGNLLVTASSGLKLVDYDGMYLPSLAGMGASEKGHPNYQSPFREGDWGSSIDNFSAWIIYASLVALSLDSSLWSRIPGAGDEALLFHRDDFLNPSDSEALAALDASGIEQVRAIGRYVAGLCTRRLPEVPALGDNLIPKPATAAVASTATGQVAPPASGAGEGDGIPEWVPWVVPSSVGAGWISSHLPPPPDVQFARLGWGTVFLVFAILALPLLGGVLAMMSVIPPVLAMAVGAIFVSGFLAVTLASFHESPERGMKVERQTILAEHLAIWEHTCDAFNRLAYEIQMLDEQQRARVSAAKIRLATSTRDEVIAVGNIDRILTQKTSEVTRRRERLGPETKKERGRVLQNLQQQHLDTQLSRHRIATSTVPGLGPWVVGVLYVKGIRTAADFAGVSIAPRRGWYGGETASIRRRDGSLIRVWDIGPQGARSLDAWRSSLEAAARATQPTSLPLPEEQAIRQEYTSSLQQLVQQEQRAQDEAVRRKHALAQKHQSLRTNILAETKRAQREAVAYRAKLDAEIVQAQRALTDAEFATTAAQRDLAACHAITYPRYLARLIRG